MALNHHCVRCVISSASRFPRFTRTRESQQSIIRRTRRARRLPCTVCSLGVCRSSTSNACPNRDPSRGPSERLEPGAASNRGRSQSVTGAQSPSPAGRVSGDEPELVAVRATRGRLAAGRANLFRFVDRFLDQFRRPVAAAEGDLVPHGRLVGAPAHWLAFTPPSIEPPPRRSMTRVTKLERF